MRVIDLTTPLVAGENVAVTIQPDLPVYLGQECYAWDVAIKSHTGTYFETSSHVFRDGQHTSDVPAQQLLYACALLLLSADAQGGITGNELARAGKHVQPGDAIIVVAGSTDRYFERDAVAWMIERGVALLGGNLTGYDTGFENPTGIFIDLFRAEIPIIAGLANLDQLTQPRFELIVAPLPVRDIGTVPARIFAVER